MAHPEHIGLMFQNPQSGSATTKKFYSSATRVALDSDRLTAQKCAKCSYMLTRTFLCMQCATVHCPEDAEQHYREERHTFGEEASGWAG
jgi:ubiquitin carboxyl-terminal hydrolase 22/27/51